MTLLIACLMIYHFEMAWWWYGVAAGVWIGHLLTNSAILAAID